MERITTWADGYGVWHASVPAGEDSERVARDAIIDEIRQRSHESRMAFVEKHMTVRSVHISLHGTHHYVEQWPDDFPELAE